MTNSMISQVKSLPMMIRESFQGFDEQIRNTLDHQLCLSIKRIYLTGCGDSHHASLTTELAFETLTGLPVEPMTAMQFSHYAVGYLPNTGPGTNLVIGISVSGEVARTLEALQLANQAGAVTLALTATPGSRVDQAGQHTIFSTVAPFPDPPGVYTPGVRSYAANQLALLLIAIRIAEVRGALTSADAASFRKELLALAEIADATIAACEGPAQQIAHDWSDAQEFVFAGAGPNYGTALFSAAKVLEASGDSALGQEIEEWAHLQYFARTANTPTFLIDPGERGLSRTIEVATASRAIGRRLAVIAPPTSSLAGPGRVRPVRSLDRSNDRSFGVELADIVLPTPAKPTREMFSPLVAAIPGELFAAFRAEVISEPFFRNFAGGRSIEGGGGISRIRDSQILTEIRYPPGKKGSGAR